VQDEGSDLRENLAALGSSGLADRRHVLEGSQTYRGALLRQFIAHLQLADVAT